MGGRGGSLRGSQGVSVTRTASRPRQQARPQPAQRQQAQATSVSPQALAAQIAGDPGAILRMADDQAVSALDFIRKNTDTSSRYGTQQDTDTQRFINFIGWGDTMPEVISESAFDRRVKAQKATTYYHADGDRGRRKGSDFNDQLMYGPNYLSGGIHGDGTYVASDARDSAGYGTSQVKMIFNKNAKIISENDLGVKTAKLYRTMPKTMKAIEKMSSGYSSGAYGGNKYAVKTFVAAICGYNVIAASGTHKYAGYHAVMDKSVLTIASVKKDTKSVYKNW